MEPPTGTIRSCISCGYDVAALTTRTCPECGYTATDEDVALAERRALYLEATAWEVWIASGALLLGALLVMGRPIDRWDGLVWLLAFVLLFALAIMGGVIASRSRPRVHQRAFRRAWHMAVVYWMIPPLLVHVGFDMFMSFWMDWSWMYGRGRWTAIGVGVDLVAFAGGIIWWHRCWRRTSRLAGVSEAMRSRAMFRRGVLAAAGPIVPVAALFLVGVAIYSAMALLDRFFPGWEMGR